MLSLYTQCSQSQIQHATCQMHPHALVHLTQLRFDLDLVNFINTVWAQSCMSLLPSCPQQLTLPTWLLASYPKSKENALRRSSAVGVKLDTKFRTLVIQGILRRSWIGVQYLVIVRVTADLTMCFPAHRQSPNSDAFPLTENKSCTLAKWYYTNHKFVYFWSWLSP